MVTAAEDVRTVHARAKNGGTTDLGFPVCLTAKRGGESDGLVGRRGETVNPSAYNWECHLFDAEIDAPLLNASYGG